VLTDTSGADSLLETEEGALAHMNADHAEACRLYATKLLGAAEGAWRCVGIDPDGLDLQYGQTGLRLSFPQRLTDPGGLRSVLKAFADDARRR
jgi:putative heme iron utilization protein